MKNVYVVGVGLIGGSMVLDIKNKHPETMIYGLDASEEHLEQAMALQVIDAVGTQEGLASADLVILSVPVDKALDVLPQLLDQIGEHTLVVDVGSTKQKICSIIENHPKRNHFLAMHPIAGTEFSGPKAAIANLFHKKTIIICEVEKTAVRLQDKAMEFITILGMRVRYMNPEAHDKHIAYVSHLSHISSFMLGKTVIEKEKNERDIFDMAGSGFESTVRLAKSSPAMWTPIFKHNKDNVVETLNEYINNLTAFKNMLEEDDYDGIFKTMKETNQIKQILNGLQ